MSSRLLKFSLCVNLILGIAGYWVVTHRSRSAAIAPILDVVGQSSSNSAQTLEPPTAPTSFRWSDLESEDYATYVANLRKAGCPDSALRRIVSADLEEVYARKAFALVQQFHRDFWDIAARENIREYFDKSLKPQVGAVCQEGNAVLNQLLGDAPRQVPVASTSASTDDRLTDFLSVGKIEQLRLLTESYESRFRAIRQSDISPEEKETQLAQLQREMESEQGQILSREELAELQLRKSVAARDVRQLYGVDFNETELRNLAKAIDEYNHRPETVVDVDPEMLDKKLRAAVGPERFADLNRSRSANYRELYDFASDFGKSPEIAGQIFDLRLASEKQCEQIRADRSRSPEEKQASLDALQDQVEQTIQSKLGATTYQAYKSAGARWINSLGRL
ncbi:MAG: hypothetical protein JWO95_2932 [Verrucomicrobiales bacterium]|nr:hypothetical protein [Verrucomicrobiales bacterium]